MCSTIHDIVGIHAKHLSRPYVVITRHQHFPNSLTSHCTYCSRSTHSVSLALAAGPTTPSHGCHCYSYHLLHHRCQSLHHQISVRSLPISFLLGTDIFSPSARFNNLTTSFCEMFIYRDSPRFMKGLSWYADPWTGNVRIRNLCVLSVHEANHIKFPVRMQDNYIVMFSEMPCK